MYVYSEPELLSTQMSLLLGVSGGVAENVTGILGP